MIGPVFILIRVNLLQTGVCFLHEKVKLKVIMESLMKCGPSYSTLVIVSVLKQSGAGSVRLSLVSLQLFVQVVIKNSASVSGTTHTLSGSVYILPQQPLMDSNKNSINTHPHFCCYQYIQQQSTCYL